MQLVVRLLGTTPVVYHRHSLRLQSSFHGLPRAPPPPRPSLSHLADGCRCMAQLKQVHAQMIVTARIHDNYAASRILSFSAASDLHYALNLFRHTDRPNSFMWNTVIRAHADGPSPFDAVLLYADMLRDQNPQPPGKHTYPFLLKACANLEDQDQVVWLCKQIHAHVCKHGFISDLYVANGLIRCYGVGNMLYDARKLFDGMPERNSIVWTTMVSGYAQSSRTDEALVLFDRMVKEGIEPNEATFACVLSACARSGCLELGEQIRSLVEAKGMEKGVILGTALVDMYAKNGLISKARDLFSRMQEKNTATWNAMICGLAQHGHADAALELFRDLEKEGLVVPSDATFVGVLSACCHSGYLDVGRQIFHSMSKSHGITPKIEHYGCMVDLLGRSGRLTEAEQLVKSMRWEADVAVLGALLTACEKHKNLEIAERVARQILDLEPSSHGVYVVLSNMYAVAGRWGDVARLRKVMRSGGLRKTPGWSCVDDY